MTYRPDVDFQIVPDQYFYDSDGNRLPASEGFKRFAISRGEKNPEVNDDYYPSVGMVLTPEQRKIFQAEVAVALPKFIADLSSLKPE